MIIIASQKIGRLAYLAQEITQHKSLSNISIQLTQGMKGKFVS